jgi:hypothetical protein
VLRGGSFNNNHRNARCANRNRNNPNNSNNNGFRVCVSHIFAFARNAIKLWLVRRGFNDGWMMSWLALIRSGKYKKSRVLCRANPKHQRGTIFFLSRSRQNPPTFIQVQFVRSIMRYAHTIRGLFLSSTCYNRTQ